PTLPNVGQFLQPSLRPFTRFSNLSKNARRKLGSCEWRSVPLVVSNIVSSKKPRVNSPTRRSFAVRDQSIDSQSNSESELGCVCDSGRGHMPGNPEQCRLNAARCLKLAKRARRPEMRETFTALAVNVSRISGLRARLASFKQRAAFKRHCSGLPGM